MRLADLAEDGQRVAKSTLSRGIYPGSAATHPELRAWWIAFQKEAARVGIPLRVVWGFRTWEQQAKIHAEGHGVAPGLSAHNYGLAVDVIHTRRAWEHMPREGWALLGVMGKEVARKRKLDLEWGGDFRSRYDPAHWQIANWVDQKKWETCAEGCKGATSLNVPYST